MANIFHIENIEFRYPFSHKPIRIKGQLDIAARDCVLIKGNSGSGKSTLLMILKGLIPHFINGELSGKVLFHDQNIAELSAKQALRIGYLQQNPDSQLICATVFDELAFGLENCHLAPDEIKTKIITICAKFNIPHLLYKPTATLSGGQKQLINLLAILLLDPEVLLLDEPTAFLDPDSAQQILAILHEYIQDKAVVIIEHNHHYLPNLVNRVINIDDNGDILQEDMTQTVWHEKMPVIRQKNALGNNPASLLPVLAIKQLSFAYTQNNPILDGLDLTVAGGEIVGIVGANGSGKSTLLRLICGVIKREGQIFLLDKDIARLKKTELWQKISLVWQNPETHFMYTQVEEELNHDMEAATQLGLATHLKHSPFSLSEGQKRRLSIGIVAQLKPQLLLLDEPTFGQDYANKIIVARIIARIADNGTAVIIVSHDFDFLASIADTTYELKDGNLRLWYQ